MVDIIAPTAADATAIAAMLNAGSQALHGTPDTRAEDVAQWFASPGRERRA